MNLVEELQWRGLVHDIMPGTEEQLLKEPTAGYIGFDPTADSLHIGSLVPIMLLVHLQRAGHNPIALVGGATGMIGDPSGKSEERNLLDEETLRHHEACIKAQLEKFLDFKATENPAELVNNYDWIKGMETLDFLREVGKHITISYMQAKDSVKSRMESGLSYTEFSYQLIQGYDFYYLWKHKNCKLQMGGSDQWGNIVTGTELIRRKEGGEAFALTCPLVTKADGGKFGKTEEGNVWLDPKRTSPYKFYQFWLNVSDDDAAGYIRVFTLLSKMEIEALEKEHAAAPHERALQKALAKDVTVRVHSEEDWKTAVDASQILFGKTTADALKSLPEKTLLEVFDGVPQASIVKSEMEAGIGIVDLLSGQTKFLSSKGEARRALKENSISVNKQKVGEDSIVGSSDLLNNRYVLLQKGKKNYFLVKMV